MDYRNSRFTSENPDKIIKFYDGFKNRDDLIEWMKERPKGVANIHEVDGDKEIIVVIPTADFNGKYAKECRENIFKGLHIIFVESGGRGDFYFNYAHNCNLGIKKALEYDPKWIVISNDDIHGIDDVAILSEQLKRLPSSEKCIIYLEPPGKYYSYWAYIGKPSSIRSLFYLWNRYLRLRILIERKFRQLLGLRYLVFGVNIPYRFLVKHEYRLRNIGSIVIFSAALAFDTGGIIFDENFINGTEDVDFSVRVMNEKVCLYNVNFKIGSYIGGTLGKSTSNRTLREVVNIAYLNYKISKGMVLIPK